MEVARRPLTIQEQLDQIDLADLIRRKLDDRTTELTLEERITLLVGCIRMGGGEISKMQKGTNRDSILFIGNTGSGKSTLINYLAGCEMDYIESEAAGISSLDTHVAVVKPNSRQQEIMKIGHTAISETFIPNIASIEGRIYCDCPGFLDNRGVEINVANIVNTRRVIQGSRTVKVVLLINFQTLGADRGRGLEETIEVAKQLFGNRRTFQTNSDAILTGITKVPEKSKRQKAQSINSLKNLVRERTLPPFEKDILDAFADNLFIYHPLDEVDELIYSGGVVRRELLTKIDATEVIRSPKNIFNIALDAQDEKELREICDGMSQKIASSLEKGAQGVNEAYQDANVLLEYTYTIREIDHPAVNKLVEGCRQTIVKHFSGIVQLIDQELSLRSNKITSRAEELFNIVTAGISVFGEADVSYFESAIGLESLKKRYAGHQKRIQFFAEESRLKAKEREFRNKYSVHDFVSAEKVLAEIKDKLNQIGEQFGDAGLTCSIDAELLDQELTVAKKRKADLDAMEEEHKKARKEWTDTILKMQEEGRKERSQLMQEMRVQMQASNDRIAGLMSQIATLQTEIAKKPIPKAKPAPKAKAKPVAKAKAVGKKAYK